MGLLLKLCVNAFVGQTEMKIPAKFTKVSVTMMFFILKRMC